MKAVAALFFFLVTCLTSWTALAERRVALVIGNGAYQHVTKLPNPANDARSMAELLKSVGFEVFSGVDLSRDEMVNRVAQFGESVRDGADAAVIFYAGHGVQIAGKNYLIPVDANLHSAFDVKANAIDADDLVDNASGAKVKLVLLDACRDNPFAEQMSKGDAKTRSATGNSGLAAMQSAEGTMISFATSPGAAAIDGADEHSPFTRALLDNLAVPGVEINDAMMKVRAEVQASTDKKQLPWANTNMTGKFFIVAAVETPAEPAAGPQTPSTGPAPNAGVSDAQAVETAFWQSAQASGRREEYLLYLSKYPKGKGQYSELAELRLAELDQAASTGGAGPGVAPGPAPGPKPDPRRAQERGCDQSDRGCACAGHGPLARGAKPSHRAWVRDRRRRRQSRRCDSPRSTNWQTARGYKVSGFLNKPQIDALLADTAPAGATAAAPTLSRSAAPTNLASARLWNATRCGARRRRHTPGDRPGSRPCHGMQVGGLLTEGLQIDG